MINKFIKLFVFSILMLGCGEIDTQLDAKNNEEKVIELSAQNEELIKELTVIRSEITKLIDDVEVLKKEILNNEYVFYLTSSINLNEVEINSNQATTKYSIISTKNIQTITSGEIAKAACCNLSECFETNASVDVNYSDAVSGIKTIKMLGLAGKYVKINNESLPLMTGLLNSYGLSYVPGSWIESIQILKGMGSVLNGHDAITGEINVEYFKPDDKDKIHTNLYFNSEGKLEKNFIYFGS